MSICLGSLFENASVMLEVCRGAFEKSGYMNEAHQLRGLEATSRGSAEASLFVLRHITARDEETQQAKAVAEESLRAVIRQLPLAS